MTSPTTPSAETAPPAAEGLPDPATLQRIGRSCICYQTRMTAHAVTRAYNRALAPLGLEVTQFNILICLAGASSNSVTALSDALALDRTTMTRNLKRLEQAGLVGMTSGQGRAVRPALTEPGARCSPRRFPCGRPPMGGWRRPSARRSGPAPARVSGPSAAALRPARSER